MDPPYSVAARRVFREYNSFVFDDEAVIRLREWLVRLATMGVDFLVSYADCEEASFLKEGFDSDVVRVRRNIAGFSTSRGLSQEVLFWSTRTLRLPTLP